MEFEKIGEGQINLIFLHGWGAGKSSFAWLGDYLDGCAMHFASLDGFDRTKPPQDPTVAGYANRLKDYIDKNRLKNVILVGHSFGGRIAIEYCSNNSIKGLVLVDSAGIKPKFSFKKLLSVLKYKWTKELVKLGIFDRSKLNQFGSSDYRAAGDEMRKVLLCAIHYNQKHLLKKIDAKTLVVWGKNDKETPMYMARQMQKHIKNSDLVILDGGHFSFLDEPYKFCKVLEYFVKEIVCDKHELGM